MSKRSRVLLPKSRGKSWSESMGLVRRVCIRQMWYEGAIQAVRLKVRREAVRLMSALPFGGVSGIERVQYDCVGQDL